MDILFTAGHWALVAFGFGFLIFIHELGHFLAAKRVGIRVERFSLGFGPRLIGTNKRSVEEKGSTDYCLCAIPFGGYVKMAGGEGEQDATGAPDEFPSKTPGQRAFVVAAGPVTSVLVALPLFFGLFTAGLTRPSSRVNRVVPGSPAWKTGIRRGDVITGLGQQGKDSWTEIRLWREVFLNQIVKSKVGDIVVRVRRAGAEHQFNLTTTERTDTMGFESAIARPETGYASTQVGHVAKRSGVRRAGIVPGSRLMEVAGRRVRTWREVRAAVIGHPDKTVQVKFETPDGTAKTSMLKVRPEQYLWLGVETVRPNVISMVRPDFPAARAGLKRGDKITAVNGQPVKDWWEFEQRVLAAAPGEAELAVDRAGEELECKVQLDAGDEMGDVLGVPISYPVVTGFAKGSKAEQSGLKVGATLLRLGARDPKVHAAGDPTTPADARLKKADPGGYNLTRLLDLRMFPLGLRDPEPLTVMALVDGKETYAEVTPIAGQFGIIEASPRLEHCPVVPPGHIGQAAMHAFRKTAEWVGLAFKTLVMLFQGRVSADMVSGPIGIVAVWHSQAELGFLPFVELLVIITVHLGVINLVPFPILDGGHLLFLLIEKLRGRPLQERVMARILYGGMAVLAAVMLFVTWNDITKLPWWPW